MTAHRPAQIARLSATVVAGAASLSLTVAAGAYIVNNMPEIALPPTGGYAAPAVPPEPGEHRPALGDGPTPRFTSEIVPLAMSTEQIPAQESVATYRSTAAARADDSTLTGQLRIGTTYVGAQVAPAQTDTVAFTVDTNLVTIASKYLGGAADPSAVTALRTEFDTRRGELVFVLTDPALGSHTLRIERVQKPGQVPGEPATGEPAGDVKQVPTTVDV
ncbi:hypothetical protein [Nocardia rhizosphaerae]|uniref:Uncharacterized protein n=1 Tax=Nocardia rhizosphaerae TaxID=1691571 RepID=A0ABV8L0N2_9NOCA